MAVYATSDDFEAWLRKPVSLTDSEITWLDDALAVAAVLIRNNVDMTDADADRLLAAKWVSCEVVADPFATAWNRRGLASWTETTGAIVESATVANPSAQLYLNEGHLALFGIKRATGPKYSFGAC